MIVTKHSIETTDNIQTCFLLKRDGHSVKHSSANSQVFPSSAVFSGSYSFRDTLFYFLLKLHPCFLNVLAYQV